MIHNDFNSIINTEESNNLALQFNGIDTKVTKLTVTFSDGTREVLASAEVVNGTLQNMEPTNLTLDSLNNGAITAKICVSASLTWQGIRPNRTDRPSWRS